MRVKAKIQEILMHRLNECIFDKEVHIETKKYSFTEDTLNV